MSSVNVGGRIQQLRLALGMSIRNLAAKTGFSPSLISQVEHGQVMPSIGSLERIAMALGVSLGKFFAEPDTHAVGLVRASARQKLTSTWSPVSIEALGPMDGSGRLEAVMMTMAPGGRSGTYPATDGRETFAFIVEGDVTLTLGDEVYRLGTGDAMTFAPAQPHRWENPGAGIARVLLVVRRFSSEGHSHA
jgi:transcriptional regulator with XRE-family HTH domain